VPEKKASPSRLLIMLIGTFLAFMFGTLWVLGKASWQGLGAQHPVRLIAHETYTKIQGDLGLTSGNGTRFAHMRDKILWFKRPSK
jgi:hypothetical protein